MILNVLNNKILIKIKIQLILIRILNNIFIHFNDKLQIFFNFVFFHDIRYEK